MRIQERRILEAALAALAETTGMHGRVIREAPNREGTPDAVLELERNRRRYRFAVEIKAVDRFQTPALVKAQLADVPDLPLLVAPYIARETADQCRVLQLPFLDTAGNAYLEAPDLFVYVTGQRRAMEWERKRLRALTPAGLQIIFALLCRQDLLGVTYRELAKAAAVALGTVGPVLRDLKTRGFLRLERRRPQALLEPLRLVEEWATYYPTTLRPRLNPRRFEADPERLRRADLQKYQACWGGEVAAERLTHFLQAATFTIYAREPIAGLLAEHRMRANPRGNVEILDRFWQFATTNQGVVPPLLAYADLLATHDGRNIEAARLLHDQWIKPIFNQAK